MGFYSFYKIIKDIVRTIFGNRVFRLILIACVCGFFLCLISEKVQASYEGDTNGYFDNIQVLTQYENTFNISSKDNNSNIQVKIKANTWNYSTIIVLVENNNNFVDVIKTNGDFKYNFTNNTFSSTDYMYYMQVRIENGVADLTNATNNGISANFATNWGAWSSSYKIGLYGNIYDYNNDNLVASSIPQQDYYFTVTELEKDQSQFTFGSSSYGGTRTVKMPSFIYNYKNIVVCMYVNPQNTGTKTGCILFSNDDILINNNTFYGVTGGTYYFKDVSFYSSTSGDFSNYTLSDFILVTLGNDNSIASGYFRNTYEYSNYSYIALLGSLYDKNTGDIIIENNPFFEPFFEPSDSEIQSLNWDNIFVELGDFDINENPLYIHRLEVSRTVVGTGAEDPISYYYNNMSIKLAKGGKYWRQLLDTDKYYFSIPMSQFNFKPEKAYFLILTDNPKGITSSIGKVNKEYYNTIFQIVEINSGNLITMEDVINNNIEKMGDDVTFLGRTIEESLSIGSESNKQLSEETNTNIDTNLNFNNQNSGLNNINNGFFSRLTTLISSLLNYDLSQDTTINIPYPNSNKNLTLHSNIIYSNLSQTFQALISSFWYFVFGFYMWRFINKIYIAVSTGHILDTFSSSGEAITNDML